MHHHLTLGFRFAVVELMADRSSNSLEELMEDEEFSSADGDRSTYGDNDSVSSKFMLCVPCLMLTTLFVVNG